MIILTKYTIDNGQYVYGQALYSRNLSPVPSREYHIV